jgi:hypothetical protein
MEEMCQAWNWSGRCLRSIRSLAKQWDVDISGLNSCETPVDFEVRDTDIEHWFTSRDLSSWMGEDTALTQDWDNDIANSKALDDIFSDQSWMDMVMLENQ